LTRQPWSNVHAEHPGLPGVDRQPGGEPSQSRRLPRAIGPSTTTPPLIFLDEPTTGLDPRTRGQMWETIRGPITEGWTVLLSTQYLDEADQLAGRIAVIDRGRQVAEGTPDELKASVGNSTLQVQLADGAVDRARSSPLTHDRTCRSTA
jgi:ABC-type multidrug transport system ATPase subunit